MERLSIRAIIFGSSSVREMSPEELKQTFGPFGDVETVITAGEQTQEELAQATLRSGRPCARLLKKHVERSVEVEGKDGRRKLTTTEEDQERVSRPSAEALRGWQTVEREKTRNSLLESITRRLFGTSLEETTGDRLITAELAAERIKNGLGTLVGDWEFPPEQIVRNTTVEGLVDAATTPPTTGNNFLRRIIGAMRREKETTEQEKEAQRFWGIGEKS